MKINNRISIPDSEIEYTGIRAQGAGGQNVNKVETAVHLRFDIAGSSLPSDCKESLLALSDKRISREGIIVIKAQRFRSREKNLADALERLRILIAAAARVPRKRIKTRPGTGVLQRRREDKNRKSQVKDMRRKIL